MHSLLIILFEVAFSFFLESLNLAKWWNTKDASFRCTQVIAAFQISSEIIEPNVDEKPGTEVVILKIFSP
jgi:hypothetical protein